MAILFSIACTNLLDPFEVDGAHCGSKERRTPVTKRIPTVEVEKELKNGT